MIYFFLQVQSHKTLEMAPSAFFNDLIRCIIIIIIYIYKYI